MDKEKCLIWASYYGYAGILKVLVKEGAFVSIFNDIALRNAASRGHLEAVRILLEAGADFRANDREALQQAADNGHLEVFKLIREHGRRLYESTL